jgi:hypothetical protein
VKFRAQLVRRRCDDREAAHPLARRGAPSLPQAGQSHQLPVGQRDRIGLLPRRGLLPLVEVIDRNEAAPLLECFAEGRLSLDPLGLGVDVREADFDVQNGTSPQRITSRVRSLALASYRTTGRGSVGATFQLGAMLGVGRSGGIENTSLISLTSEERRARPHMERA